MKHLSLYIFQNTFHYNSELWSNEAEYNFPGGITGFDNIETKLPTFSKTSFTKICLGVKIGQQINFIFINQQADSLYSLIADRQYRDTSLGRDTWKSLIGINSSLLLEQEESMMIQIHGETRLSCRQIMVTRISRPWGTFLFSSL